MLRLHGNIHVTQQSNNLSFLPISKQYWMLATDVLLSFNVIEAYGELALAANQSYTLLRLPIFTWYLFILVVNWYWFAKGI